MIILPMRFGLRDRCGVGWFCVLLTVSVLTACGEDPSPAAQGTALADPPPSATLERVNRAFDRFRERKPQPDYATPKVLSSAMESIMRNDYGSAESLIATRLEQSADDPHALYIRGYLHHRQKLYAAARPDFEKVLEAVPTFPSADGVFLYYAWCCYYLADLDAAKASFQATFDLDVDKADATYGLGMIAFDQGELDAAERAFEKSLLLFEEKQAKKGRPNQSDLVDLAKSRVRLGSVFLRRADTAPDEATGKAFLADARKRLEEAVRLIPFNDEAWFNLSRVYGKLGETALEKIALEKRDEIKARQGKKDG